MQDLIEDLALLTLPTSWVAEALLLVLVEALDSVLALQVEMCHSVEPQELEDEEALVDFQARRVPSDVLPQRLEAWETA